jgi:hypothetical protein
MPEFIVVSGVPGAGKSTVGRLIAGARGIGLLDKDALLETLFGAHPPTSLAERGHLSRLADQLFQSEALTSAPGVLVSWWRHPLSGDASGTPTEWLGSLPGTIVEVHCHCAPAVAVDRFLKRQRHYGHLDSHRRLDALIAQITAAASLGPLGVGRTVSLDTSGSYDVAAICDLLACSQERRTYAPAV